jgi:hypothetical protein
LKECPKLANGIDACLQEYGARSLYLLKNSLPTSKKDMFFLPRGRSPTAGTTLSESKNNASADHDLYLDDEFEDDNSNYFSHDHICL